MDLLNLSHKDKSNIYVECLGGYTSIAFLKRCPDYIEAKKNGNMSAAEKVVEMCVDQRRLSFIRLKYADCTLIPVMSENNALPVGFADCIGLAVCLSVRCVKSKPRKNMSAVERIIHKPRFYGYIEPNKSYILVDDIMTLGGTFSSLIKFVIESGGYVCAVTVLAYAKWSRKLMPEYDNYVILTARFGADVLDFFKNFGVGTNEIDYFTHSEIFYLLRFSNVNNIKKRIKKCFIS